MSYENAPATELVATHCAFCGRPLVDANSLAAGVGPECRKKYALPDLLAPVERDMANRAIYEIATQQTGDHVADCLRVLRSFGLVSLCERIQKRLASDYEVVIAADGEGPFGEGHFTVKAGFELAMRADLGLIRGRRWDKERKLNRFPDSARRDVFEALKRAAPGALCFGPRGEFRV